MSDSPLPPLYAGWLDELLAGPIPPETHATCSQCAMCPTDTQTPRGLGTFDPTIKCCTFIPELFNFLVGRVLQDEDPDAAEGRATVLRRIEAGFNVTPIGLGRSSSDRLLYQAGGTAEFGRTRMYRCPHYLSDGRCGVWRHRESTCATWFCKYDRGDVGSTFWKSLHALLETIEKALATWCLVELDLGADALAMLFPQPAGANLEGEMVPEIRHAMWGRWAGRELEFYRACAKRVDPLRWAQVLEICGPETRVAAALVVQSWRALTSDEIPARVSAGTYQVVGSGNARTQLVTYNPLDPISVPSVVLRLLPRFDGRPVPDVLEEISREEHITVKPSLVRRLVDYRVLVSAE